MAADERTKSNTERTKARLDEFIAKVVPDPKKAGEALLVTGFLGTSSEPQHTRIYWDASLSTYVDAETADILHTEPLAKEQSPLGGSYIWLKRDAQVFFGSEGGQRMHGKFFQGPLMAAYGGQFGAAGAAGTAQFGAGVIHPTSIAIICHPTVLCTQVVGCHQSVYYPCLSANFVCTPLCPVNTVGVVCVASPGCPPVGPGTPVQGGGGEMAAAAAAMPQIAGSYAPGCWFSYDACPTMVCGHGHTPPHPMVAQAIPSLVCSYAPHCWYSWGACPTQGGCGGPHPTRPMLPQEAFYGAAPQFWSGYCPWTARCSFASCGHPCTI